MESTWKLDVRTTQRQTGNFCGPTLLAWWVSSIVLISRHSVVTSWQTQRRLLYRWNFGGALCQCAIFRSLYVSIDKISDFLKLKKRVYQKSRSRSFSVKCLPISSLYAFIYIWKYRDVTRVSRNGGILIVAYYDSIKCILRTIVESFIYDCCMNIFNNASHIRRVLSKCNLIISRTLREMKKRARRCSYHLVCLPRTVRIEKTRTNIR